MWFALSLFLTHFLPNWEVHFLEFLFFVIIKIFYKSAEGFWKISKDIRRVIISMIHIWNVCFYWVSSNKGIWLAFQVSWVIFIEKHIQIVIVKNCWRQYYSIIMKDKNCWISYYSIIVKDKDVFAYVDHKCNAETITVNGFLVRILPG